MRGKRDAGDPLSRLDDLRRRRCASLSLGRDRCGRPSGDADAEGHAQFLAGRIRCGAPEVDRLSRSNPLGPLTSMGKSAGTSVVQYSVRGRPMVSQITASRTLSSASCRLSLPITQQQSTHPIVTSASQCPLDNETARFTSTSGMPALGGMMRPNRASPQQTVPYDHKPPKSRPNRIQIGLSDAGPHNVLRAKRTKRAAMNIGYARVSTSDQTAGLEGQQRDLKAAGVEKVFSERVSSVTPRVKLAECLAFLREGDVLTVPSRIGWHAPRPSCCRSRRI
jgi:Resolvase, N terminal domain